jgi:hypothetical protein
MRNRGLRYLGNGRWEFDLAAPASKGCYFVTLILFDTSQTTRIRVN